MTKFKNLVLSGGGTKCIAHLGVLDTLIKYDFIDLDNLNYIIGVSGGAILAVMLAVKYSLESILYFCKNMSYEKIFDDNFIDNIFDVFTTYGVDSGDKFLNIIKYLIKLKTGDENMTFESLYNYNKTNLIISGTCLDTKQLIYFERINYPNLTIAEAVRISASIPIVFKPYKFNNKVYIDGGLLNCYPIDYFESVGLNDEIEHTVGLRISDKYNSEFNDLITYIKSITNTFMNYFYNVDKKYKNNTVFITYDFGIKATINFNLSIEDKLKLFNHGVKCANYFVYNKLFNEKKK